MSIYFITDLPNSSGYTSILVIIDCFSKSCRLVPLKRFTHWYGNSTLFHQVFRVHGLPEDIMTDRGSQITSWVWQAFCRQLDINISLTSGYHQQASAQVERPNQEVGRYLRTYCSLEQNKWSDFLAWAEYAWNSLIHSFLPMHDGLPAT